MLLRLYKIIGVWLLKNADDTKKSIQMTLVDDTLIHTQDDSKIDVVVFVSPTVKTASFLPVSDSEYWLNPNHAEYNTSLTTESFVIDTTKTETLNLSPMSDNEKLSALDELFYRSKNYHTSKNYIDALSFVTRMKNIAPFNAWLLRGQNPDITYVATASEWRNKFNRVLAPKTRAYIILRQFGPIDFVYDIADTLGEPLPEDLQAHFRAKGNLNTDFVNNIMQCCVKKGIKVTYNNTLQARLAGWAAHDHLNESKQITINADHPKEVQFSTLCHEIAHLMLGHLGAFPNCQCEGRTSLSQNVREIEAESVSWLVCQRLGIETDADRYLYECIANNDNNLKKISIENILMTAGRIEKMALKKECFVKKLKNSRVQQSLL